MVVHFSASTINLDSDLDFFRSIAQIIRENGSALVLDWIETAYTNQQKGMKREDADWQEIIHRNIDAGQRSDVVILEVTENRYLQGFLTSLAPQLRKPMLILTRIAAKRRAFSSLKNEYIVEADYKTVDELSSTVKSFLKANELSKEDPQESITIDRDLHNYLTAMSRESGRGTSDILADLARSEMLRSEANTSLGKVL